MDLISFCIAELRIWLDARASGINFAVPEIYRDFVSKRSPKGGLYLRIRNGKPMKAKNWQPLYTTSETWKLWQDKLGNYIFIQPEIAPPKRQINVDKDFRNGEVIGGFLDETKGNVAPYPLQNIEVKIFINWLAGFGDIILHAVGVKVNGCGYCFAGSSGSGKSTLASRLVNIPGIEILGEDNIVLRYLDNQFWIYGTPWHLNPKMCSAHFAPLKNIYFLDRTIDPGIANCAPSKGVTRILQTAFIPYYRPETLPGILDRLNLLTTRVPFGLAHYKLGSDPVIFFKKFKNLL